MKWYARENSSGDCGLDGVNDALEEGGFSVPQEQCAQMSMRRATRCGLVATGERGRSACAEGQPVWHSRPLRRRLPSVVRQRG